MKKLLFALFVVACGTTLSAQSTNISNVTNKKGEVVSKKNSEQDTQIKNALAKDADLQKQTVDYLQSNKETQDAVRRVSQETDGSTKSVMDKILKNKDLTDAAVKYIKENPELLKKAMSVVGM